jgi:3-oxoacyl-[acyl-carrier protein] reductase
MSDLDGVVALVTGSSRGIGAATARLFAAAGAAVAVHGRDRQAAAALREQIEAAGGRAIMVLADLTDLAQIEASANVH